MLSLEAKASESDSVTAFTAIMSVEIVLCTVFLSLIIYQIAQTERSKQEIMAVFALLNTEDLKRVYDICDDYIERFDTNEEFKEFSIAYIDNETGGRH